MSERISRRALLGRIGAVGALALGSCVVPSGRTSRVAKLRTIGYLSGGSVQGTAESEAHFRQRLLELGYAEGRDIAIEVRIAENLNDRLPGLVSELLDLPVDLLVTQGTPATLAAKLATSTIPIVFIRAGDPVGQGIVASLARPGGNVTGISAAPIFGRNLEYLQATVPGLRRIAVLSNASNPAAVTQARTLEAAAQTLGLDLRVFDVHTSDELDVALDAVARWHPDALQVGLAFTLTRDLAQLPDFAATHRLPAIYSTDPAFVRAGGLMASGSNTAAQARRAADLVDKILEGARPADLPVEPVTQLDFIVNLEAAQRIGLTMPESLLRQATEVIR